MSMNNLKDVYIDQMQDIYSANTQSARVTQKLADAAKDPELKKALQAGVEGIEQGKQKLKTLIEGHGADPEGEHCKGMEGLVAEANAHALEEEFGDDDTRDAMIITQYQRMVHYGIAGYGCLKAFANRLGLDDEAREHDEMLSATYDGDSHMNDIATGGVNAAAAS